MLCLCALRPLFKMPAAASCPQGAGVANKSLAHAGGGNRQSIRCLSTAGQFSSSQKENNIRRTAPHPSPYHYHRPYLPRSLAATGQSTSLIASLPPLEYELKEIQPPRSITAMDIDTPMGMVPLDPSLGTSRTGATWVSSQSPGSPALCANIQQNSLLQLWLSHRRNRLGWRSLL